MKTLSKELHSFPRRADPAEGKEDKPQKPKKRKPKKNIQFFPSHRRPEGYPDLTTRQYEILEYIRHKYRDCGHTPTIRDIGNEFVIRSPNGVMCHLRALKKKGYLAGAVGRKGIALSEKGRGESPCSDQPESPGYTAVIDVFPGSNLGPGAITVL